VVKGKVQVPTQQPRLEGTWVEKRLYLAGLVAAGCPLAFAKWQPGELRARLFNAVNPPCDRGTTCSTWNNTPVAA
jgi:hypothetical protein